MISDNVLQYIEKLCKIYKKINSTIFSYTYILKKYIISLVINYMEGLIPMYCKKQIKRKAMLLSICSILGVGSMVDDHAMAMKSLKKLLSSVPSQEKIMKLARCKLGGLSLGKSDEEKLNAYVNNIIDERGYIKIEENNVVNPIIYCLQKFKNIELFTKILNWIDEHIPAAFTSRENIDDPTSATPLFFAINKKFASRDSKGEIVKLLAPRSDITAVCKYKKSQKEPEVYITAVDLAYQRNLPKTAAFILSKNSTFNEDVLNGNIERIIDAVSAGKDVNTPVYAFTGEVFTPLEIALMRRDVAMFDYLISCGGKVSKGNSVLDLICSRTATKERLNLKTWPGSFEQKDFDFVKKVLVCEKLELVYEDKKHSIEFENIYLDKELYELFKQRFGKIPKKCLSSVCRNETMPEAEKIEIVNGLKKDGALTDSELNYAAKIIAIENNNLQLLKHLHSLGAKKNYTTDQLCVAIEHGASLELVRYLVEECNVSVNGTDCLDRSLCHAFRTYFSRESQYIPHILDIAKYLIEKGMNVNGVDSFGRTLLNVAESENTKHGYSQYSKLGVELQNIFVRAGAKKYLD